jgi:hypothetical protein
MRYWRTDGCSAVMIGFGPISRATGLRFNALYKAVSEEGDKEATAVEKVIRVFFNSESATVCLDEIDHQCISKLIAIPPGDDRHDPTHPRYREKTACLVGRFNGSRDPLDSFPVVP